MVKPRREAFGVPQQAAKVPDVSAYRIFQRSRICAIARVEA
jgi:hypothetical protein